MLMLMGSVVTANEREALMAARWRAEDLLEADDVLLKLLARLAEAQTLNLMHNPNRSNALRYGIQDLLSAMVDFYGDDWEDDSKWTTDSTDGAEEKDDLTSPDDAAKGDAPEILDDDWAYTWSDNALA